ncbi:hypothetical protein MMC30_008194 [Trapelia coarctata]|nr:hypothetical protein [Trapelia coarctata]
MEAYKEVMEDRDLGYWKSEIVVKNLSNDESSSKSTLVSKRKRADGGPGIPHATETDDCEDDDESHLFAKEPKVKQEPKPSHSPPDSSDEESTGPRMKRQKGSMSMKELTPSTASKPVPQQKISDDQVRIYVGNPQHHFMVPKAGLKQSDLLQSLIECENGEAYIMSPLLSSIDPLRFKSVAEYLDYGEYVPSLLNEGSSKARLDIVGDRGRRSAAMEQCSIVFKMGEDLQLSGLQDLVVRKFRVLTPEADDDDFVLAAGRFNSEGRPSNPDLHEFMVARFAQEHFSIWIHRSTLYRQFCLKHRALEIEIQRKRVANYDEEIAKAKAEKTEKEDDDPQSAF